MADEIKILPRQSLFDIAVQECRSTEAAIDIALRNGLSITDRLQVGDLLKIDRAKKSVIIINPATEIDDIDYASTIANEGIEFWAIEEDFIIS